MTTENTEKRTRTPRTFDSIKAGALSLTLREKVNLCKDLKTSIDDEVKKLQEQANAAGTLLSTLQGVSVK